MHHDKNKQMIKRSQLHLRKVNEGYFEHLGISIKISIQLLLASLMGFMHALIPSLFITGASRKITKLYIYINKRNKLLIRN